MAGWMACVLLFDVVGRSWRAGCEFSFAFWLLKEIRVYSQSSFRLWDDMGDSGANLVSMGQTVEFLGVIDWE